ncbi:MAG: DUF3102 domain-containing protein [Oscillospiraceae bacterium]|jgi:hypothetical protein|nr:DUF3102 domain-containing protein [Oscillospiraceae bacterium]
MTEELTRETKRTLPELGAEIRAIHQQTQKTLINASIEIGRRLSEAKTLCAHGDFMEWIKTETPYGQSTANNLIRIFEEYGAAQYTLFGAEAKSDTLGNLTYSQALKLLAVPEDEREEFVAENRVEEMSTRELDKLIKERDEAKKAQKDAEKQRKKVETEAKNNADKLAAALKKLEEAQTPTKPDEELFKAAVDIGISNGVAKAQAEVEELLRQKEALEARAAALEKSVKTANPFVKAFEVHFGMFQETFEKLADLLSDAAAQDAETAGKLRKALNTVCGAFAQQTEEN